jgi:hypothetical protein
MRRKESMDVPMWLEEGLCQLIQSEVNPSLQVKWAEDIARTTKWYPLQDLWNDLSSCEDVNTAYLQAYKETTALVKKKGKARIIQLLYLNRTHHVNWNDLSSEGEKMVEDKYVTTGCIRSCDSRTLGTHVLGGTKRKSRVRRSAPSVMSKI